MSTEPSSKLNLRQKNLRLNRISRNGKRVANSRNSKIGQSKQKTMQIQRFY